MTKLRTALLASALMMIAAPVFAGDAPMANSQDGLFIVLGSQGNMTEIATSKLARDRSQNADVKTIASQMIDDHTKLLEKSGTDAENADIHVPSELDAGHQMELDQLKQASDADFDALYLKIMDKEHREAVMAFKDEATMGQYPALVADAKDGLPIVQNHQMMVVAAEKKMGINPGLLPSMADKPAPGMAPAAK